MSSKNVDSAAAAGGGGDGDYRRYSSPTNNNANNNNNNNNNAANLRRPTASSAASSSTTGMNMVPIPPLTSPIRRTTDLHRACSSPSSSLSKLRATLLALGKSTCMIKDENGNLPLHLLGRNELLIHLFLNKARYDDNAAGGGGAGGEGGGVGGGEYYDQDWMSLGEGSAGRRLPRHGGGRGGGGGEGGSGSSRPPRTELDQFVIELVSSYPRSAITPDADGRLPLTDAIRDWIEFSTRDDDNNGVGGGMGGGGGGGGGDAAAAGAGGGGRVAKNYDYDFPPTSNLGMGSARGENYNYTSSGRNDGGGGGGGGGGGDHHRLEGMSQLMGMTGRHDGDDNEKRGGRGRGGRGGGRGGGGVDDGGSNVTGRRSVLDNVSLPSAFRSAYSASGRLVGEGVTSRASYRDVGGGGGVGGGVAAGGYPEFRNVWSATVPRPDGPSSSVGGGGGGGGVASSSVVGGGGVGQSDVLSNPPEDGGAAADDVFPLNLAMPPIVEWSLRMISAILDGIESSDGQLSGADDDVVGVGGVGVGGGGDEYSAAIVAGDAAWIGNTLVSSIASMPSFMKTLLLLCDKDPAKSRVFHLSIVRRVISSRHAIGNWLVYMLEAVDPIVARRGVDYLEILSEDEDENALIPSTRRVRYAGTQLSPSARAALYYKVSKLDYFLPAILALEETSEVDRASKTKLLRHILDQELGSRPTITMAFFDLFFLLLLLVTFQMSVYHVVEGRKQDVKYATTYFLSMIAALYAILRKFGQMSSMIKISRQAFVENNFRWVDAVDWLAILLVVGGIVWMAISITDGYETVPVTDYMRSYLAAAICGVWLKLVSWLSVINWQVINLVGLFSQIVRGIRWILLFLVIAIFASSQMLYVMLSGLNCDDNGYCEKDNAYLQVWAILLGQFDASDFQTTFSVIAFVAFTFVTYIILGYALIATSIDIYNKAVTFRSENSAYGDRSRFVYIAELHAFRRLFDQRWTAMQYCAALLFLTSSVVIFLFAAVEIREALGQYYSGGVLGGAVALLLIFLFVSITAFVSHMTYYSFVEESGATGCASCICRILASNCLVRLFSNPIERLMRFIVDIDGIHLDGTPSTAKYTDSWQGSATHVRCHIKRMLMQSEAHMTSRLRNELFAMEMRHKKANEASRSDVLMEIRASEERMERIMSEFQGWMDRRLSARHQ